MAIASLRLQHFRSYSDASFTFTPGVNIIVGPNASGKTNLLEAVLVVARGSSYRGKDVSLVQLDQPWARLDAQATISEEARTVKLETEPLLKKSFVIHGQSLSRLSLPKTLPVVVFEPNHLLLLHGSPELRRNYLDDVLEQTVVGHTTLRHNYRRVLAQRNSLLKKGLRVAGPQIFPWDIRLSELGGQIARQRQNLVETLNQSASQLYAGVAGIPAEVSLEYDSQWHADQYESHFLKRLESHLEIDVTRGFTTAGPHRDDLLVSLNKQPAAQTASRGETRSLILLCKIMELQLIEQARGQTPLLLLDDVFSELDSQRRQALIHFLQPYQTFITTTDADLAGRYFAADTTVNLIKLT